MAEQRLINAEHIRRRVKTECNPYGKPTIDFDSGCAVLDMIDAEPTVDAVPVVRCKDCMHYEDVGYCDMRPYEERKSVSYYCADGVRKDDDANE